MEEDHRKAVNYLHAGMAVLDAAMMNQSDEEEKEKDVDVQVHRDEVRPA